MLYKVTKSALGTMLPQYLFSFDTYISNIHIIMALTYHQTLGHYRLTNHILTCSSGRHEWMTLKGKITTMWLKGKPISVDQISSRVTVIIFSYLLYQS